MEATVGCLHSPCVRPEPQFGPCIGKPLLAGGPCQLQPQEGTRDESEPALEILPPSQGLVKWDCGCSSHWQDVKSSEGSPSFKELHEGLLLCHVPFPDPKVLFHKRRQRHGEATHGRGWGGLPSHVVFVFRGRRARRVCSDQQSRPWTL